MSDVVRRLPRAKRADVAFELRSLLGEELEGRAADTGSPTDAAMATDLLKAFGSPVDVADRYRPAGFTIIRPADAPRFAQVALIGVGVQWVVSLIAVYSTPVDASAPGGDWLSRLGSWWLTWGLGSFWWPGFIVTLTMIAAYVASKRKHADDAPEPSVAVVDRDRVKRPLLAVYFALGMVGAAIVIALPSLAQWAPGLPQPVLSALALDEGFLAERAPWVLLFWAAVLASGIALLVAGRWTPLLRKLAIVSDVAWIALLLWWLLAGPIFVSAAADGVTKGCLGLLVVLVAVDGVMSARRLSPAFATPAV